MMREILEEIAREVGLTIQTRKEKKDSFNVVVNPQVKIVLNDLKPGIELHCLIAKIPDTKKEDILMHMMEANFRGQGTGGNILGVDEKEKKFTLRFIRTQDIDKATLHNDLETFVNYLLYWRNYCQEATKA